MCVDLLFALFRPLSRFVPLCRTKESSAPLIPPHCQPPLYRCSRATAEKYLHYGTGTDSSDSNSSNGSSSSSNGSSSNGSSSGSSGGSKSSSPDVAIIRRTDTNTNSSTYSIGVPVCFSEIDPTHLLGTMGCRFKPHKPSQPGFFHGLIDRLVAAACAELSVEGVQVWL